MDDLEAWRRIELQFAGLDLLAEVIETSGIDTDAREAAIDHPSISDLDLIGFMHGASDVVVTRCLSCTTRISVLEYWLLHGTSEQRIVAAWNPSSGRYVSRLVLSDPDEQVRRAAMYSPALTDDEVRWHALNDPSEDVRAAARDALESELGRILRRGVREFIVDDQR